MSAVQPAAVHATTAPPSTGPTPASLLLGLQQASVMFGPLAALHAVSLHIHRGDRIALVGANGAGKTTLLRLLNGLQSPSSGQRLLPAGGVAPVTAMLFQRPFFLHFSVRRNLQLALWLAGVPTSQRGERVQGALQRVGMVARADAPARSLSGGQQQRLALARAWAVQPDILFLDEPTASLDPSARREVEALIDDFGQAGMALVMSTHNLGQAKRLANRVLYLDAGRLLADLPVHGFFNRNQPPPAAALFLKGELPWS